MAHYFTNEPELEHDEFTFEFELLGQRLQFTSDAGVFSRHTVDFGSRVLIDVTAQEKAPQQVLDVGCGYGPIGLSLAKFWPRAQVTMGDVNRRALALAERNAAANQITNATILESDAYAGLPPDARFELVVTNPPVRAGKAVVTRILEGARAFLQPGGVLLVVLQKKQGAPSALKLLKATYASAEVVKKERGYYILRAVQG